MKQDRQIWTPAQVATLRELYPTTRAADIAERMGLRLKQVVYKAHKMGLRKLPEIIALFAKQAMENPNHGGRQHQFSPEQTPWNKGVHWVAGGRAAETRFKPGNKPHTHNPVGHERITKDGYLQRKMTDTGVTRRDYVMVHHLVFIEHFGAIPPGGVVVFRDGNLRNITPDNLECITRKELMARNTVHRYPKEIARLVQLRGVINHQINQKNRSQAA